MNSFINGLIDRHTEAAPKVTPLTRSRFEGRVAESGISLSSEDSSILPEEAIYNDAADKTKPVKDSRSDNASLNIGEVQWNTERTLERETIHQPQIVPGNLLSRNNEINLRQPPKDKHPAILVLEESGTPTGTMVPNILPADSSPQGQQKEGTIIAPNNPFEPIMPNKEEGSSTYSDAVTSSPAIKISIGSIEVRTQQQKTSKPVRAPRSPRKPKLTLDDYLKKRK